jgi:AAHS family 4-hydroxybenzoate transporter-like MFS transporter
MESNVAGGSLEDRGARSAIDDLPMSAFQVWSVLMIAATVILDGLDNQMLGLAAPSIIAEWGVSKADLGQVFALAFVGMAIGTLAAGSMGDRFGRRGALLAGVTLFGFATLATGFSTAFWQVAMLKIVAGIGLGGVPGTASAMIAEFTPARWRSVAVTFGVVCVSIGGIIGGVAAALIVPVFGWRWLFYAGGIVTLLFTLLLWFILPESPRFLATRPERRAELERLLARMGFPAGAMLEPAQPEQASVPLAPIGALFQGSMRRDTLALSIAMFSGMFMIYLMFNWAPTLLFSVGFDLGTASLGLTSFNLGGTIGAMIASLAIVRYGSRPVLITMAFTGAAVCLFLALLPLAPGASNLPVLLGLVALGLFASAAQSAMFAVGAHAFPTLLRARGLGVMGAVGRAGAIVSALAGAMLVGAANLGFFGALAGLMLINAVGFIAIRGHVPRLARSAAHSRERER